MAGIVDFRLKYGFRFILECGRSDVIVKELFSILGLT